MMMHDGIGRIDGPYAMLRISGTSPVQLTSCGSDYISNSWLYHVGRT